MGMVNALTPRSISMPLGLVAMLAASGACAAATQWLGLVARPRACRGRGRRGRRALLRVRPPSTFYFARRYRPDRRLRPSTCFADPLRPAGDARGRGAAVRVSHGLRSSGRGDRAVASLQLAGFAASALAFALGLARPRGPDTLFSGNTLAAAVLGLVLYGRARLRETGSPPTSTPPRSPPCLLAYFSAHLFIKDLLQTVEGTLSMGCSGTAGDSPSRSRRSTGWCSTASWRPCRCSSSRRWNDARLVSRHCHYIGLPLAVAACVLSAFEPLAGVLVMGGYAAGFGVATWVYANPALEYLACLSLGGSLVMASTYLGDLASGARSLAIASIGLLLWGIGRVLSAARVPQAYRVPILLSARGAAAVGLVFAAWSAWAVGAALVDADRRPVGRSAALYVLIGRETPGGASLAYAVASCAAVAALLSIRLTSERLGRPADALSVAIWAAGLATIYQVLSPWLAWIADRREADRGSGRLGPYPAPLLHIGLILSGFAAATLARFVVDRFPSLSTVRPGRDRRHTAPHLRRADDRVAPTSRRGLAPPRLRPCRRCPRRGGSGPRGVLAVWTPSVADGAGIDRRGFEPPAGGTRGSHPPPFDPLPRFAPRRRVPRGGSCSLACSVGSDGSTRGSSAITLTMTAVTLALLIRQKPVRPLPELALATGLAAWLVGWGMLALAVEAHCSVRRPPDPRLRRCLDGDDRSRRGSPRRRAGLGHDLPS